MIGFDTLAMVNGHVYGRRRPMFSVMLFCPYDGIRVPLAAKRYVLSSCWCAIVDEDAGNRERSAPESIRKLYFVVLSTMNRRCEADVFWPVTCASMFAAGVSFLNACILRDTFSPRPRIYCDNSNGHLRLEVRMTSMHLDWMAMSADYVIGCDRVFVRLGRRALPLASQRWLRVGSCDRLAGPLSARRKPKRC